MAALVLVLALVSATAWAVEPGAGRRPIRLQLKWSHQFQFAGYYIAYEKGWYRDAGFDVRLLPGGPALDPAKVVAAGGAEFGVGNSSLIIDRIAGLPLVAVAALFQHSPFVLLARRTPGLNRARDLAGRTVMVEEHAAELTAYLKREGLTLDQVRAVPHTGDATALARAGIDAMSAYSTTEPFDLIRANIPFQEFSPRSVGIDYYGDTLFTTRTFADREPAAVRAFRAATVRGWSYALDHSDEVIDLILSKYGPGLDRRKLEFEAEEIRRLMLFEVVDLGYMSRQRWHHIAKGFAEAGLVKDDSVPADFLFEPDEKTDLRWLYGGLGVALASAAALSAVALRFRRLNGRLRLEIASREELEQQLMRLAATDSLTGALNRRAFLTQAETEFTRARRFAHPLAVLALDLDHFKAVNDGWGHATGDRVLCALADACRTVQREVDILGRFGGEEFMVLLPESDAAGAMACAERLRQTVAGLRVLADNGDPVAVTVSIGVAQLADDQESIERLLARADDALYAAKRAGRNCAAAA